ncbi:MAG: hypothetical protein N3G76_03155 [Candidatus Micrarchaeota archaeon]|nr:hypothetical protein [Candidatus Micrarchaeota archaeon]
MAVSPSFAFNATYLDPTFQKPWEFNRISLPDFVTNVLANKPGKTDIDTSYMFALQPEASSQLREEINHIKSADANLKKTSEGKLLLMSAIQAYFEEAEGKTATALAAWLVPLVGTFIIIDAGTGIISETTDLGSEMLSICKEHYTAAVTAAEEASLAYNGLQSKVDAGYRELRHMGALSPAYKGQYANDIAQLESTLSSIDGNMLRDREARIKAYAQNTERDPSAYRPLVSESVLQARYLLDGQQSAFSKLLFAYTAQKSIKEGLMRERESARSSAETRLHQVSEEYTRINKEYGQITDSDVIYFGIATLDTLDSPSIHISKASEDISASSARILEGDQAYLMKSQGYITESTASYYMAVSRIDSAAYNLKEAARRGKFILSSAENITQKEYAAATAAVASFIPKTQAEQKQLEAAKRMIKEAERSMALQSSTASERLSNLKVALNSLRLARAYLSPDAVFRANAKDSAANSLSYLKSVIDRAKADAVDVSYEEDYYNRKVIALQSGNLPPEEMVNISLMCGNLTEQLFLRGAAQYSQLSLRYAKLLPLAAYIESLEGKRMGEFLTLNKYLGRDGAFDRYLSLGHYKEISGIIAGLEAQVEVKAKELIRESLIRNTKVTVEYGNSTMHLDSPVLRKVRISTYSTVSLGYTGPISLSIPLQYDLSRPSATAGSSFSAYSYSQGTLSLLLEQYQPNKMYTIYFEDSQMLVRTVSVKSKASLTSPTMLKVTVERQVLSLGVPYLRVPQYYNYPYMLYYNGEYAGSFNYDADIRKEIPAGTHLLTAIYSIENPFVITAGGISATRTSTSLSISVKNTVPFDIENPTITYDLPVVSPTSVSVSSPDCTIVSTARTLQPSSTRLAIMVKSIPAGAKCTFDMHATAPISKDSIEQEIARISNDSSASKSKEVNNYLNKARSALDAGRFEEAFKAVSDADKALTESKQAAAQALRQESEIGRLSKEISAVLANLSSVRDPEAQKSILKIKSYYDSAASETSLDKKLELLRKADNEVLALNALMYAQVAEVSEKLNKAKQRWLQLIDKGYAAEMPKEIMEAESLITSVSASSSPTSSAFSKITDAKAKLDLIDTATKNAEKDMSIWESTLKDRFKQLVSSLKSSITQLAKACGASCPVEMISYSQALLSLSPQTPNEYSESISKINKTIFSITSYIATERAAANSAIGELKSAAASISDPRTKDAIISKIHDIESMYAAGEYSRAKESAIAVKASITSAQSAPTSDYTLVLVGLAVIIISFIILKIRERNSKAQDEISRQIKILKREK